LCLALLEEDELVELWCEHHEDFLLKRKSSGYAGVQVKTRDPQLGPFVSNDEPVVKALARFVQLELDFPNQFERFVIVANCDFLASRNNEKSLPDVVRRVTQTPKTRFSGTMKSVIAQVSQQCKCKRDLVIDVLKKTHLDGNVPKFEDIIGMLAIRIGKIEEFNCRYLPELYDCAEALLGHVLQASALSCDMPARSHYVFATDPKQELTAQVIRRKRVTADLVLSVLRSALQVAVSLQTANGSQIQKLPLGHHRLEKKMAAGGISFPSIEVAKDLQVSSEFLLQNWLYRYGPRTATDRYGQLDLIVRTQCAEAYDDTFSDSQQFGTSMLASVRQRLKSLGSNDPASVFGARYEHLLGLVSLATQECNVWWSKKFDISDQE
jgi:hypothetical protein